MLLDNGADVNAQTEYYDFDLEEIHTNALQAASSRGHKAIVKMLLDYGADTNAQRGLHGNALKAGRRIKRSRKRKSAVS
jgi:ankyrin repeat protein